MSLGTRRRRLVISGVSMASQGEHEDASTQSGSPISSSPELAIATQQEAIATQQDLLRIGTGPVEQAPVTGSGAAHGYDLNLMFLSMRAQFHDPNCNEEQLAFVPNFNAPN